MTMWATYTPDGMLYALFPDCREACEEADACNGTVRKMEVTYKEVQE